MAKTKQYECVALIRDINPVIKKGMPGVILEVLDPDTFIVEFVQKNGTNYEFNGQGTFELKGSDFMAIP